MKHVNNVIKLTERAMRNGEALGRKKHGKRVYRAEYEGDIFTLYHYETPILYVFHVRDTKNHTQRVTIGDRAYSPSDRDAINSALAQLDIGGSRGNKPYARIRDGALELVRKDGDNNE